MDAEIAPVVCLVTGGPCDHVCNCASCHFELRAALAAAQGEVERLSRQRDEPKMQRRYPDISIADVEKKLKRAAIGPKGDRHDYAGAPMSCRESGVVLKELDRLRAEIAELRNDLDRAHADASECWRALSESGLDYDRDKDSMETVLLLLIGDWHMLKTKYPLHSAALAVAAADQRLREHRRGWQGYVRKPGEPDWYTVEARLIDEKYAARANFGAVTKGGGGA